MAEAFFFRLHFVPDTTGRTASVDFTPAESAALQAQSAFFGAQRRKAGPVEVSLRSLSDGSGALDLPPEGIDVWRAFLGGRQAFLPLEKIQNATKVALFALLDVAVAVRHTALEGTLVDLFVRALVAYPDMAWFIVEPPHRLQSVLTYYSLRLRDDDEQAASSEASARAFNYLFPPESPANPHGLSDQARLAVLRKAAQKLSLFGVVGPMEALYLLDNGVAQTSYPQIGQRVVDMVGLLQEDLVQRFVVHMRKELLAARNEMTDVLYTNVRTFFDSLLLKTLNLMRVSDVGVRERVLSMFKTIWKDATLRLRKPTRYPEYASSDVGPIYYSAERALLEIAMYWFDAKRPDWQAIATGALEPRKAALVDLLLDEDGAFAATNYYDATYPFPALVLYDGVPVAADPSDPSGRKLAMNVAFIRAILEARTLRDDARAALVERVLGKTRLSVEARPRLPGSDVEVTYQVSVLKLLREHTNASNDEIHKAIDTFGTRAVRERFDAYERDMGKSMTDLSAKWFKLFREEGLTCTSLEPGQVRIDASDSDDDSPQEQQQQQQHQRQRRRSHVLHRQ